MATAAASNTSKAGTDVPEDLTTLSDLRRLEERYPFDEAELEILARCHDRLLSGGGDDDADGNSFLMKLALASPYSAFFLPGDEMRQRVEWVENQVLPPGFASGLRAATSADAFVEYANQGLTGGHKRDLERFVEGVADTGRRGSREALRVVYEIAGGAGYAEPRDVVDACFRLAFASEAIVEPNLNRQAFSKKMAGIDEAVGAVTKSLVDSLGGESSSADSFTLAKFVDWAETKFPMLSSPLSTFVHHLVFHGHAYPHSRIPYQFPSLDNASDVFSSKSDGISGLVALSFAAPALGGKVRVKREEEAQ